MQPLRHDLSFSTENASPSARLGYHISESTEEEKVALRKAFDLVTATRKAGAAMRTWAAQSTQESRALLKDLKKHRSLSVEMKLWELSCWENKILLRMRNYMSETSDLMNRLKPLNPPLKTEQVRPFHEAMMLDRSTTVEAMEPLTKAVAELTRYKSDLHLGLASAAEYRPS